MTETLITFDNAMLLATTCLVGGMFVGMGMYALGVELFGSREYVKVDHDAAQRREDKVFAPLTEEQAARLTP